MLSLTTAVIGFAALAKAMQRRRGTLAAGWQTIGLRTGGALLLVFSCVFLCVLWGTVDGLIGWLCLAAIAALLVVVSLSGTKFFRLYGKQSPP